MGLFITQKVLAFANTVDKASAQVIAGVKTFSNGIITALVQSAADLTLKCAADKTTIFDPAVYDDFVPSVSVLATGAASPDAVNATIQSVIGSYYGFDGGATEERLTIKIELYHGYKEGSDIEVHVHAMPATADAGDAVWYFDYFKSPVNGASAAGTTLSKQFTIGANTQYYDYTVSLGTISGVGLKIGDFIIGTLRRTPSSPDTYPGDLLLKQVAAHAQLDTLGSRQRYIK